MKPRNFYLLLILSAVLQGNTYAQTTQRGNSPKVSQDSSNSKSQGLTVRDIVVDADTRDTFIKSNASSTNMSIARGLPDGSQFRVVVQNVNIFSLKVEVKAASQTYFANVPAEFKGFQIAAAPTAEPGGVGVRSLHINETNIPNIEYQLKLLTDYDDQLKAILLRPKKFKDIAKATEQVEALLDDLDKDSSGRPNPEDIRKKAASLFSKLATLELVTLKTETQTPLSPEERARALLLDQAHDAIMKTIDHAVMLARHGLDGDYLVDKVVGPFTASGDEMDITVTFTEVDSDGKTGTPEVQVLNIPTNGGIKIEFSAGLMVSSLVDFKYTTQLKPGTGGNTNTPAVYIVQKPTSEEYKVGQTAFLHVRNVIGRDLGITFGISGTSDTVYALGLSYFAGRKQRMVFTAGLAFGKVSRFDWTPNGEIDSATPSLRSFYMGRPFVGISFNF